MKNLLLMLLAMVAINLNAQLTVQTAVVDSTVLDWLEGSGVEITNLEIQCGEEGYGIFLNPDISNGLELVQGLIMTSGDINDAVGPNNSSSAGSTGSGISGDPDLELAIPGFDVNDVCVIEFDAVPVFENLIFDYVFGSDEYPEFVNTPFNDVFGFFVSGPGIEGEFTNMAENFAKVPDADIPVSIDNVNEDNNSDYYISNGDGLTAPFNEDDLYIQYDGFTVTLTGSTVITPGETYHIKVAIADAGDTAFDSGVFLTKDCFKSVMSTSLDELENLELEVFPNPTVDFIYLRGDDRAKVSAFEVMTLDGKKVMSEQLNPYQNRIDLTSLANGLYVVQLIGNDGVLESLKVQKN